MERTEDRSKALSFIGIEVAEALKGIPKPVEMEELVVEENKEEEIITESEEMVSNELVIEEPISEEIEIPMLSIEENNEEEILNYQESILVDKKPSLWQKFKNSKLARAVSYVFKIRIRVKIELPNALPEGRGE